jgi:phage terminase small subunit
MSNQLTSYRETVTIADLTQRQAKFVQAYVELGTRRDGTIEAALAAGYGSGDRAQAKSRAYELLHNPKILAVLRNEITTRMSAAAVIGTEMLIELATNAKSEQVRLGAARELVL